MSRASAVAALSGEVSGLVSGISWVPEASLDALVAGTGARGPAESLEAVARALELDFAFVPAQESWAIDAVDALHAADAAVVWAVPGVLGRLAEKLGWAETIKASVAEPGLLAGPIAQALHEVTEAARAGLSAGVDVLLVADELAGATGPLVSPDFALDALVPSYEHVAAEAAVNGVPAALHSDGDIRVLMPALRRAGLSAVHLGGLGADALEASLVAARFAQLTVVGGIEVATLLEGARHAGERAARWASAGGFVLCDDGGFTRPEEVAAYATALEAARTVADAG